jgi:hypothetical protein
LTLRDDVTEDERDAVIDDLLSALEREGLSVAGHGDRTMEFIVRRDGSQATDADRGVVRAWAERWAARADVDVGEVTDVARSE